MLWVGIDEAGYGPNLGPLVMTAVVAEGPDDAAPDVWVDLASTVSRAGGPADRLWVDDSKRVYASRRGRDRLDAACLAVATAPLPRRETPETYSALLAAFSAGSADDVEFSRWITADPRVFPGLVSPPIHPLDGARWRIVSVRSVVVGPARFNAELAATGSKARVHWSAFAILLGHVRDLLSTRAGGSATIAGDKHGGRHFYGDALAAVFPEGAVSAGPEGPELSRYAIRTHSSAIKLSLLPRADASDGLVALASLASKSLREIWMDGFNAHWVARVPGLAPTAGYPVDAARFRREIEPYCDLPARNWWREK